MFKIRNKEEHSIGEKIDYYSQRVNNPKLTSFQRAYAKARLEDLSNEKRNVSVGDVYVVDDSRFGNPVSKPRFVVVTKSFGDKVEVVPVREDKSPVLTLFKFDYKREISFTKALNLDKDVLYSKEAFDSKHDNSLTSEELDRLLFKIARREKKSQK